MKVEKIDHIHARVKNLDGAIALFTELLGIEFFPVSELHDTYGLRDVVNAMGNPTLTGLHLMEITDPNGVIQKELGAVLREGIAGISLKVPDIEEAITEMTAKGIEMVGPVHQQGGVKQAWFNPAKTFGIQIELCEYPGEDIRASAGDMKHWR